MFEYLVFIPFTYGVSLASSPGSTQLFVVVATKIWVENTTTKSWVEPGDEARVFHQHVSKGHHFHLLSSTILHMYTTIYCRCVGVKLCGEEVCPVIYLRLVEPGTSREKDEQLLQTVANECMEKGVAIATSKYLKEEVRLPPPR